MEPTLLKLTLISVTESSHCGHKALNLELLDLLATGCPHHQVQCPLLCLGNFCCIWEAYLQLCHVLFLSAFFYWILFMSAPFPRGSLNIWNRKGTLSVPSRVCLVTRTNWISAEVQIPSLSCIILASCMQQEGPQYLSTFFSPPLHSRINILLRMDDIMQKSWIRLLNSF